MKLVILVPAYNEETIIGTTLKTLPDCVEGFTEVEILVVDDGSTDRTVEIAREEGARVLPLGRHVGLAQTFARGLLEAVSLGADCIGNFDADGQ